MNEIIDVRDKNSTIPVEIVMDDKVVDIPTYFTDEELKAFFYAIENYSSKFKMRDKVFFLFLLSTGLRVSEAIPIKKRDIDFETRHIRVRQLKKRKLTYRVIRLHKDIAYWLSIYVANMNYNSKIFPFSRYTADDLCKKYCRLAHINYKRTSCHIFRHTFAKKWLEQGKPIHKLKFQLGHRFVETTMNYLKIVNSEMDETVDNLDPLGFLLK